jgi:hypothetical protein
MLFCALSPMTTTPTSSATPAAAPSSPLALWRNRSLRFGLTAATTGVLTLAAMARTKWFAIQLDVAGVGVIAQVFAAQNWLAFVVGLGLALPLSRAVSEARAHGDAAGERAAVWTTIGMVSIATTIVFCAGMLAARPIAHGLLGSAAYGPMVRAAVIGMVGAAAYGVLQAWLAGRSDVRGNFTMALAGGIGSVAMTLLMVPRFGLLGAVLGAATFFPCGVLTVLVAQRAVYGPVLRSIARPLVNARQVRAMLPVGAGALVLALVDQGTLLALRAHLIHEHGFRTNGYTQAALALAQQTGAIFYAYLGTYAFGMISAAPDVALVRAYTRKHWNAILALTAVVCVAVVVASGPLLRLLYSDRFDPARSLLGWTLLGEFGRVAMVVWALGSLPLGGVPLWFPIMLSFPASLALAYPLLVRAGVGVAALPMAYAFAGTIAAGAAAWMMSRRGVTLARRHVALLVLGWGVLAVLARWSSLR